MAKKYSATIVVMKCVSFQFTTKGLSFVKADYTWTWNEENKNTICCLNKQLAGQTL